MEVQFSFGTKHELIVVNGQTYINRIGALLQCAIDVDWTSLQTQIKEWSRKEIPKTCWHTQLRKVIENMDCHPVITQYIEKAISDGTIDEAINTLAKAKDLLLTMLETIVDEDKSNYDVRLYELLYKQMNEQKLVSGVYKIDGWNSERIGDTPADVVEETGRRSHLATEDITSLLCLELKQMCIDQCIIRKCANCRRFFWTRITKKIYCNRLAPGRMTTCNQYGPQRKHQIGKRPAFNLYWTYRTKVFHRMSREKDSYAFQAWVKATQPYKEAAQRGEISLEDMKTFLEKVEMQVFPVRL